MLIDSEIFTEVNPTVDRLGLDSELGPVQASVAQDAAPAMALLDASSLNTVLAMLEVIDSAEELALLETLTPEQKRQVWDATPEPIRERLKQLRNQPELSGASEPQFAAPSLPEAIPDGASEAESVEQEETLVELELSEPLDFVSLKLAAGDWVVLQARPHLTAAELMAIWEVLEVQGQSARIIASKLGSRTYPIAWMLPYPKPIGYVEPEF